MAWRARSLIVVFDASTFVSAALKANSRPEQALLRGVSAPNRLLLSQAVEDEYREVSSGRSLIASLLSNVASASLILWSLRRSGSNRPRPSRSVAIRKMTSIWRWLLPVERMSS